MMTTRARRYAFCAAFVTLLLGIPPKQTLAQDEPTVLRGITPWVETYYWSEPFFIFQRLVNERLDGRVRVDYLGAEEIVPSFDQLEALRNGVVDVILGAASYYTGQIPEAMAVVYSRRSPVELRESGFYDLMREIHLEKGGVVYLANTGGTAGTAFRLFMNREITTPDLDGLRIRVTPVYIELVQALNGTPIAMPPSEVYTALERGVVDGYGWSYGGLVDYGWHEVTDYVIDHPFFTANTAVIFNREVWDHLPEDIRAELEEIGKEVEIEAVAYMDDYITREDELLRELGLKFIQFSPEDAEFFLNTAYDTAWSEFIAAHPEVGPKLRELSE